PMRAFVPMPRLLMRCPRRCPHASCNPLRAATYPHRWGLRVAPDRPGEAMATLTVQERNWAALSHASGAILMFLMASFGFVGPLLIYLMKHEESPAIRYHAKQALYFQLAMTCIVWVCGALGTALSCFLVGFV